MPITNQLINGHVYDYSSIEISIDGTRFTAVSEINYESSLEVGTLRGTAPNKLGTTRGQEENSANFTMYNQDFDALVQKLLLKAGGGGFGEARFPITVTYSERLQPTIVDTLSGCRIISTSKDNSQGTDPSMTRCTIDVTKISYNGASIVGSPGGNAASKVVSLLQNITQ